MHVGVVTVTLSFAVVCAVLLTGALAQRLLSVRDSRRFPPPGMLVDVGGYRLHLWCRGTGGPVVVMDAGLGGSSLDWSLVAPRLAAETRVCTYDRAGYGWSEPGPLPRTSERAVAELHTALERSGLSGPYILVGHSFGGLNMRLFASRFPGEVAGIVLVDAAHEDRTSLLPLAARLLDVVEVVALSLTQLAATFGLVRAVLALGVIPASRRGIAKYPPALQPVLRAFLARTRYWHTMRAEDLSFERSTRQMRAARQPLGDLPLVALVRSARPTPGWFSTLSPRGIGVTVERSGHFIHLDQPALVAEAVARVVRHVRENTPTTGHI